MNQKDKNYHYLKSVYHIQDYIDKHLKDPLLLDNLAEISGFSKFHFHRIFKEETGETLHRYVNRTRTEKARFLLKFREDLSITDIGYYLGFSDSATFSRTFKAYTSMSPSSYRKHFRKDCKVIEDNVSYNTSVSEIKHVFEGIEVAGELKKVRLNKMNVAYLRHLGNYDDLSMAYNDLRIELFESVSHLITTDDYKFLTMYHDDSNTVPNGKQKTSLCIAVDTHITHYDHDKLSVMEIDESNYLVGYFEIQQAQYPAAWNCMAEHWFSQAFGKIGIGYPFELYLNNPFNHPKNTHFVEIYLPIE